MCVYLSPRNTAFKQSKYKFDVCQPYYSFLVWIASFDYLILLSLQSMPIPAHDTCRPTLHIINLEETANGSHRGLIRLWTNTLTGHDGLDIIVFKIHLALRYPPSHTCNFLLILLLASLQLALYSRHYLSRLSANLLPWSLSVFGICKSQCLLHLCFTTDYFICYMTTTFMVISDFMGSTVFQFLLNPLVHHDDLIILGLATATV